MLTYIIHACVWSAYRKRDVQGCQVSQQFSAKLRFRLNELKIIKFTWIKRGDYVLVCPSALSTSKHFINLFLKYPFTYVLVQMNFLPRWSHLYKIMPNKTTGDIRLVLSSFISTSSSLFLHLCGQHKLQTHPSTISTSHAAAFRHLARAGDFVLTRPSPRAFVSYVITEFSGHTACWVSEF